MNTTQKGWTYKDLYRTILAAAFIPRTPGEEAGEQVPYRALKLVVVEDSGEPYFTSANKFSSLDQLAKELAGIYSDASPEIALRVSMGMLGEGPGMCALPLRTYDEQTMALSLIGKGVDGGPVVRLAFALAEDLGSGS